jgi:hypothetical protein
MVRGNKRHARPGREYGCTTAVIGDNAAAGGLLPAAQPRL